MRLRIALRIQSGSLDAPESGEGALLVLLQFNMKTIWMSMFYHAKIPAKKVYPLNNDQSPNKGTPQQNGSGRFGA